MDDNINPLVSIMTPVYNAEKYLAECIESIRAQAYTNWEYTIVNNASTDESLKIAEHYAQKDNRIHIHNNEKFLNMMQNWNHAMRQISSESKYCKVVHADDWIYPECLEKMVDIAENYPSVGIVGAYRLDEDTVNLDGLPYPSTVVLGRDLCRHSLLEGPYVFGSPTSLLIRSELIRKRQCFYNENSIHADKEICYELLKDCDFGFVHQVLTYTRRHNEAETTHARMYNTYRVGKLLIMKRYGPVFLTQEEYLCSLQNVVDNYHAYLGQSVFDLKNIEFFRFHQKEMKKLGVHLSPIKLFIAVLKELMNPLNTARRVKTRLQR